MSKKLTFVVVGAVFLCVALTSANVTQAATLAGWWKFDDVGTGDIPDYSGNNRTGVIVGDARYVSGMAADALELNGDDYVTITGYKGVLGTNAFSISMWIKAENTGSIQQLVYFGTHTGGQRCEYRIHSNGGVRMGAGNGQVRTNDVIWDGQWHHIAVTVAENASNSSTDIRHYIDGQDNTTESSDPDVGNRVADWDVTIGYRIGNSDRYLSALVDEVRIYEGVLTPEEVAELAIPPVSYSPSPADRSIHDDTVALLSWTAGGYAAEHDVYFGTSRDDVLAGAGGTNKGRQSSSFLYVLDLEEDTTYYWRVDDVEADGVTVRKGGVWSFTVPPVTAYDPEPADGMLYVDPNVTLTWSEGRGYLIHNVYFSDSFEDVNNGTGDAVVGPQTVNSYTPGSLEPDTLYYWRIDETDENFEVHRGPVWSFRTWPQIVISDPNLVGWWTLDEGIGTNALDWSGHGNNGVVRGGAEWLDPGWIGDGAMNFDGNNDYIPIRNLFYDSNDLTEVTVCSWIRTTESGNQAIASFDRDSYWRFEINGNGGGPGQIGWSIMTDLGQIDWGSWARVDDGYWHHVVGIYDNGKASIYIDGRLDSWYTFGTKFGSANVRYGFIASRSEATGFDGGRGGSPSPFNGDLDDVRIYDKALTVEEIELVMRGDPLQAWKPDPANTSTPQIQGLTQLSWAAGDMASQHDVYWGSSRSDVADADTSSPEYKGRRGQTTFSLDGLVEFGSGPHYWRIDEVNTDSTVTKGRVWTFNVANYLLIDDFEDYNDTEPSRVFDTWRDGTIDDTLGDSQVGYWWEEADLDAGEHFLEDGTVQGGRWSMPYFYNGSCEAVLPLTGPQRDWTQHGINTLSLWHYGYPESVASLTEGPADTYTMVSAGLNIYNEADSFTFAWKTLNGSGSIQARVDSVENTNANARAGLMIRDTLDPDSINAITFVRADSTIRFNRRTDVGASTDSENPGTVSMPHWLRIERDLSGTITAYHANDVGGVPDDTWMPFDTGSLSIQMSTPMYVGLATSANAGGTAGTAVFSSVETTGNVGAGAFTLQNIGIQNNEPKPMYVTIKDGSGNVGFALNPDPNAVLSTSWTEWNIVLADEFTGVDLSDVDTFSLRFGAPGSTQPGGSGLVFIDDISLYGSRCFPDIVKPALDFSNNCVVDLPDLQILTDNWLISEYEVVPSDPGNSGALAVYMMENNLLDGSGNGNHGDPCGTTVTYVGTAPIGQGAALNLDGRAYVTGGDVGVSGAAPRTILGWAKATMPADAIAGWTNVFGFSGPSGAGQHFDIQLRGDGQDYYCIHVHGWQENLIEFDQQWHHFAATYDGTTIKAYVDGQLAVSDDRLLNTTGTFQMGKRVDNDNIFPGVIDNVRVYDHALTQGEIGAMAGKTTAYMQDLPLLLTPKDANMDVNTDGRIDFRDYAGLIDNWLDEQLWP